MTRSVAFRLIAPGVVLVDVVVAVDDLRARWAR